jgi:hypothetical protein
MMWPASWCKKQELKKMEGQSRFKKECTLPDGLDDRARMSQTKLEAQLDAGLNALPLFPASKMLMTMPGTPGVAEGMMARGRRVRLAALALGGMWDLVDSSDQKVNEDGVSDSVGEKDVRELQSVFPTSVIECSHVAETRRRYNAMLRLDLGKLRFKNT